MGRKNYNAFTLVELIIVISLLSFLVLMGILYFRGQLFKGNDAKRKSDINRIQVAIEEYEKDHDCYPLAELLECNPGNTLLPYLDKIPCDPVTKSNYVYEYEDSACPKWYRIYTILDNVSDESVTAGVGPLSSYNYYKDSPNAPEIGDLRSTAPDGTVFYGCMSGNCQPIKWDMSRPGPQCDPNYPSDNCYGQCGQLSTECNFWK